MSRQQRRAEERRRKKESERLKKLRRAQLAKFKPHCPDCGLVFGPDDHANQCSQCKLMICDSCVAKGAHDCEKALASVEAAAESARKNGHHVAVLHEGKLRVMRPDEEKGTGDEGN